MNSNLNEVGKLEYLAGQFDVVVVGAGHAGIESALAAARLGARTLCLCTCLDAVGNMPCNPSIGGTAKGQLAREIDALGGEMGKAADAACIQFRMLNRGKGPAVFSPRAQEDRAAYRIYMKRALETCPGLSLVQGEAAQVLTGQGAVIGVRLTSGARYLARAVVLATGTYLMGKTFTGELTRDMGPDGMAAATELSDSLRRLGLSLRRFKTGTPPRIDGRTVEYAKLTAQHGEEATGFSFAPLRRVENKICCHLAYTNERTHQVIRDALDRSPLFSGEIVGTGPRYCPSIEDKVVRFADKPRHQVFLEPCGAQTCEVYLQGLSTSLPEDVQLAMVRTIEGLERATLMRPGYAIEYDCLDPLQLDRTLAVKAVPGLFAAGQLCGSSGYEEAAGQGLVAGVNAAHLALGREPFVLERADGYIGTLIDDLVTKGTGEPYRMMTSRSEYRLLCRQDNADRRLMPKGHELGLVGREAVLAMEQAYAAADEEVERLRRTFLPPGPELNDLLARYGASPVASGVSLLELLRRPELGYHELGPVDRDRPPLTDKIVEQVEINVKYEGYIKRQLREVEEQRRLEHKLLPPDLDYMAIDLLRLEARQKLQAIRPRTLGQAGRISGVSPADIGALIIYLSQGGKRN